MDNKLDFKQIADAALNSAENLLGQWLPDGRRNGHEYKARNPTRNDKSAGSFSVNLNTGAWGDFATDDTGGDLISLYAYLHDCSQLDAARALADLLRLGVGSSREPVRRDAPPKKNAAENSDWVQVRPVPADAPPMHVAHIKRGRPAVVYRYLDGDGALLGAVYRFVDSKGGKVTIPHTFWRNTKTGELKWDWRVFAEPRPLYGLDALAKADADAPVLIVEGEKCKDAAAGCRVLDGYAVLSWCGGSGAVDKSDWSVLRGREVVLWPDCDSQRQKPPRGSDTPPDEMPFLDRDKQPGMQAMLQIAAKLHDADCTVGMVKIPPPGVLPCGYDIADLLTDKNPPFSVLEALEGAERWLPPAPTNDGWSENSAHQPPQGDGGESVYAANFAALQKDFALIEGKTHGLNLTQGVAYTKAGLIARFCRKSVESWLNNPRKKTVTQYEANKIKEECERKRLQEDKAVLGALERYVYLDGTSSVWDWTLFRIIDERALRSALTDEQYKAWKNSPERKVVPIDNVVFEPGRKMGDSHINIFRGMPMQPVFPCDKDKLPTDFSALFRLFPKCENILRMVYHLCNNDKAAVEWLLNWLAYPLQNIGTKMATAVVMNSPVHGSGKSLLFDGIVRQIYGNYSMTYSQTDLESSYTGNRSGVLFGLFEEIFNNKQKYDHSGSIKHMITGEKQRIERKFLDSYEESNYMNCVFLSNHIQPFLIEEHDRRFFVIWPQQTLPEDLQNKVIAEKGNGGIEAFYSLLMALPLTLTHNKTAPVRFDPHTKPLFTEAKQRVIEWGLSGWQLFSSHWRQGLIEGVPFVSCRAVDVARLYSAWCVRNKEKELPRNKFLLALATRPEIEKGRKRWRNANANNPGPHQEQIIKVGREPDGMAEMDYIGKTVLSFAAAVDAYILEGNNK